MQNMQEEITYGDLKPGQRVRVTVEGVVNFGHDSEWAKPQVITDAGSVIYSVSLKDAISITRVAPEPPAWRTGDVVVFDSPRYGVQTYVRDICRQWVGTHTIALEDWNINTSFREGRIKHVLRDGKPVNNDE